MDLVSRVIFSAVDRYPVVSMNAYNFWNLVLPGQLMQVLDSTLFMGWTYKSWGLLLFFALSLVALFPLIKQVITSIRNRSVITLPMSKIMLTCALIALLFFYFNTQMHERYAHPALIFLIVAAILTKRPLWAILGCFAYLFNMEDVLRALSFQNHGILLFSKDFVSGLYLITIIGLFAELYGWNFLNKNKRQVDGGFVQT